MAFSADMLDSAQTIVLPMPAVGGQPTVQYNASLTNASIVEMGKQLLAASRDGLTDEVSSLLSRSAPMTTDWLGTSPLHLAAGYGHCSTAEVLLRSGCSRDARTKVDKTPLHLAATEGHPEMVDLLLKSGAEVDSKDMLRMTPLHWSVERGNASCAEILIRFGADVNFENKFGKCPLELASEHGRSDLYEMLQSADEIRAAAAISIAHTDPTTSDPITVAATQSISSDVGQPTTISLDEPQASKEDAMKLLEAHGITLLPEDSGGTNLMDSAFSSKQTLTLTEAGKLALSSSNPSSPVITTTVPSFTQKPAVVRTTAASKNVITLNPQFIKSSPIQTTKSIVINTSHQQDPIVKKAPRVIRVTPEQFAAIKAGKGSARLSGLASPSTNLVTLSKPTVKLDTVRAGPAAKTIKIVRLNPSGSGSAIPTQNVQILPKPAILSSPKSSDSKESLIQKQLREIKDAKEALLRKEEELMRQLST